ncbi:MAG: hypothetical protein ICV81_15825 [Flavisolibacter sp.]|nr:hypothetical protein [Flavisolibacter sp.]
MKSITVEELKQKMDSGKKVNLVDVREPHEYQEANIGGRLVPLGKVQTMQVEDLEDLKDEEGRKFVIRPGQMMDVWLGVERPNVDSILKVRKKPKPKQDEEL